MAKLKDSGERKKFESGAVRDISEGKGRCDLLPLSAVDQLLRTRDNSDILRPHDKSVLYYLDLFIRTKNSIYLLDAVNTFINETYEGDVFTAMLEVSVHYEDGARKYSDRNWEKGIPLHNFLDSGIRHYLKWLRGDRDEPHDRAFIWNMLGAIWTLDNHPELDDVCQEESIVTCAGDLGE